MGKVMGVLDARLLRLPASIASAGPRRVYSARMVVTSGQIAVIGLSARAKLPPISRFNQTIESMQEIYQRREERQTAP